MVKSALPARAVVAVVIVLVGSLGAGSGGAARPADGTRAAETPREALRRGGTVVYVRHAPAAGNGCLTARGRTVARALRAGLRQERVSLAGVLVVPGCASRQTAQAIGKARTSSGLRSAAALGRALARAPRTGNTLIVGPGALLRRATRISLAPAEAAVFRRRGSQLRLVGRARIASWRPRAPQPPPPPPPPTPPPAPSPFTSYVVPAGSHPHDVAPAPDGTVWYTAQFTGALGKLDPAAGTTRHIALGAGSAPHGVIVGPDGAPWITDAGLNAIVRVDPVTEAVRVFALPATAPDADLNTAVFDRSGMLWFTGQKGFYGRLDPATARMDVWPAPRGLGPYGITATPLGDVYYASLQGHYVGRIDPATGAVTVLDPPTAGQGARRVWSDSQGRVWVAEWNAGQLGRYDPASGSWREWKLPAANASAYAVYVDDRDIVWLTDFGANAIVRFDPTTETFSSFPLPSANGQVRQLLGRPGELWGAESSTDRIVVLRTAALAS